MRSAKFLTLLTQQTMVVLFSRNESSHTHIHGLENSPRRGGRRAVTAKHSPLSSASSISHIHHIVNSSRVVQ
ncbi:hypothetical protein LY76DRAFT_432948 [Colletotrichum caudatum]|nr:hypothetical protein LY76DRAFT_432948 [Colletotrichum caudatum]